MKLRSWAIAALTIGALVAGGGRVEAKRAASGEDHAEAVEPEPGHLAEDMEHSDLGSYNTCDPCAPSCDGVSGIGGVLSRPIQLVFGADYLYAKANFSQALSYVEQDLIAGGETWHCYDFNYNSSYSFYGGVYLCDCGGSIIFDYTRLTSDATTAANSTSTTNIYGPFEIDDNITGSADVDLKSYDLSFAKTIPLGCPLQTCNKGCGDCCEDECCDDSCCGGGCGGGWCPAWDITWSAGVRFADVEWGRGLTAFDPLNGNAVIDSYNTRFDWNGFGGRVGLMGRRYIGRRGLVSLYAKGDWSVLMGEYDITTTVTNAAGSAFLRSSCDNVVPVTEIELGSTVHIGCHASLSAGYFWSAWHDVGMREEYDFDQFQISHYDDANILGFDGLFARAEVAF